ncbi:RNA-binding protein [uncultured Methanobrevibacter sp.]|uniref:RNA-binding protein n=1 Tax=uncultured Methanobrevibacter sp. TaxID=253161 RepID=UPI0025DB525A|nr:RNA-binding protein [uncultured Methanobrevibacter sp.]
MIIKKRYYLKKKRIKEIKNELGYYGSLINNKDKVEVLETDDYNYILVNGDPYIIMIDNIPYPTLKAILSNSDLENKKVVVDMGAVRFVTNGADIMSPGIVEADDNIEVGDIVVIEDVNNHKPLAIGESLITGAEMVESSKGKAIKSLHFVGDDIWNLEI